MILLYRFGIIIGIAAIYFLATMIIGVILESFEGLNYNKDEQILIAYIVGAIAFIVLFCYCLHLNGLWTVQPHKSTEIVIETELEGGNYSNE